MPYAKKSNSKTTQRTLVFQSPEVKTFCDALLYAKSKKTGISIMRLIENALVQEFGFQNDTWNTLCCEYCKESATTSYMSFVKSFPNNEDIFALYKIICNHVGMSLSSPFFLQHDIVQKILANNTNSNISDDKAAERVFLQCDRADATSLFYDFIYDNSVKLDEEFVPLETIVFLLLSIDARGDGTE